MASETVKLLGFWPSPFELRARIAFNIKSVAYESVEENLAAKSDLLLKSNPIYKKIPVLIHNQNTVCESLIIVQYIDEVWTSGPAILPADPYDRATHRFWATYIDDKWFPKLRTIAAAEDEEARKAAIGEVEEGLGVLEGAFQSCSKGKKFFGGERIGFLDIALGSLVAWIRVIETFNSIKFLDEAKVPGLANWAEDFCGDDAVKDVMPSTEKLAEFAKTMFTHMKPQS
ncbi:PREDICTED: glutathione S-transferase U17-like [Ipomoea nil]|uniref:glutathione S-transferase U17-like n=1 Tax=Ipomoea nil TaxID=35883 RepID=UPI00090193CD|nr:PREDICTED: glutathione S-transferase U17-like [Ipomoea nil]